MSIFLLFLTFKIVYALDIYEKFTPMNGFVFDKGPLIRKISFKENILPIMVCGTSCSKDSNCNGFVMENESCSLYQLLPHFSKGQSENVFPLKSWIIEKNLNNTIIEVLLVRQFLGPGPNYNLFPEENVTSYNKNEPSNDIYSKLDDMELYKNKDSNTDSNYFMFKICYPELDPNVCYEFKQNPNPLTIGYKQHVQGFQLLRYPENYPNNTPKLFSGLRLSGNNECHIDGLYDIYWNWSICHKRFHPHFKQKIPGPNSFNNNNLVTKIEFFAIVYST